MAKLIYLIFRPKGFFSTIELDRRGLVVKSFVFAMFVGIFVGTVQYIQVPASEQIDPQEMTEHAAEKFSNIILILSIAGILTVPFFTLLIRMLCGWIMLKIFRNKANFKSVSILVSFCFVSYIWNLLPVLGHWLNMIHSIILYFIGSEMVLKTPRWQSTIISFLLSILTLSPFQYTDF